MVNAPWPDTAALLLADAAALPSPEAIRTLLDRIGLLPSDAGPAGDGLMLAFAGTRIHLRTDPGFIGAVFDRADPAGMIGVGSVGTDAADPARCLALTIEPVPAGVARTGAVQRLFVVAAMIAELAGAQRLYWSPAHLWSPVAVLADAVAASEAQGLPPVMHLIAFRPEAEPDVVTQGLAHFCDVELRLTDAGDLPFVERVRRLARLAVHAMLVGPMLPGAAVPGLVSGEILTISRQVKEAQGTVVEVRLGRQR